MCNFSGVLGTVWIIPLSSKHFQYQFLPGNCSWPGSSLYSKPRFHALPSTAIYTCTTASPFPWSLCGGVGGGAGHGNRYKDLVLWNLIPFFETLPSTLSDELRADTGSARRCRTASTPRLHLRFARLFLDLDGPALRADSIALCTRLRVYRMSLGHKSTSAVPLHKAHTGILKGISRSVYPFPHMVHTAVSVRSTSLVHKCISGDRGV